MQPLHSCICVYKTFMMHRLLLFATSFRLFSATKPYERERRCCIKETLPNGRSLGLEGASPYAKSIPYFIPYVKSC
jgi:hypothetical protein